MTAGTGAPGDRERDGAPALGADQPAGPQAPTRRRLRLADPLDRTAAEDHPESWGDREPDRDPAARYLLERPPHHGG